MKNEFLLNNGMLKATIGGMYLVAGTIVATELTKSAIKDKKDEEGKIVSLSKLAGATIIGGTCVGLGAHLIADGITDQKLFRLTNTTFHITESGHFIKK